MWYALLCVCVCVKQKSIPRFLRLLNLCCPFHLSSFLTLPFRLYDWVLRDIEVVGFAVVSMLRFGSGVGFAVVPLQPSGVDEAIL